MKLKRSTIIQIGLLILVIAFTSTMILWLRDVSRQSDELNAGLNDGAKTSYELYKSQPEAKVKPPDDTYIQFGEGDFIVGKDVAPGRWRAESVTNCYWARLREFSGEKKDIIAEGAKASGDVIVTILPTDKGFTSTAGCGTWYQAD